MPEATETLTQLVQLGRDDITELADAITRAEAAVRARLAQVQLEFEVASARQRLTGPRRRSSSRFEVRFTADEVDALVSLGLSSALQARLRGR